MKSKLFWFTSPLARIYSRMKFWSSVWWPSVSNYTKRSKRMVLTMLTDFT